MERAARAEAIEWPTLAVLAGTYLVWGAATTWMATFSLWLAVPLAAVAIAQFSSLQHEVLHGHPFRDERLNAALVFPALTLFVPYLRFRDTHLAHHRDAILTDPYDDPESNYLDPGVWARLPRPVRALLAFNNTLLGRLLVGPAISQAVFMWSDGRAILAGERRVLAGWLWQLPALLPVALWLERMALMPLWAYLVAAYLGHSLLKIRTFLEHQAHLRARARTVIVEDGGPLALLFLNNNLHVVHHMHPRLPWYRLPALYAQNRERYRARNDNYVYRSYGEIFRRYLFSAKDPVPHPLWPPERWRSG